MDYGVGVRVRKRRMDVRLIRLAANNTYHRDTAASTSLAAAFIVHSIAGGLPETPTNGVTR